MNPLLVVKCSRSMEQDLEYAPFRDIRTVHDIQLLKETVNSS